MTSFIFSPEVSRVKTSGIEKNLNQFRIIASPFYFNLDYFFGLQKFLRQLPAFNYCCHTSLNELDAVWFMNSQDANYASSSSNDLDKCYSHQSSASILNLPELSPSILVSELSLSSDVFPQRSEVPTETRRSYWRNERFSETSLSFFVWSRDHWSFLMEFSVSNIISIEFHFLSKLCTVLYFRIILKFFSFRIF